ncbi:MAG TPA: chromosome partitioning protein ParB, partial [Thermodesulfobacteriota bacterium]
MDATRRRGLGKGLAALLPTAIPRPAAAPGPAATETRADAPESGPSGYFLCEIAHIRPNAAQPRRHFSEAELASLA